MTTLAQPKPPTQAAASPAATPALRVVNVYKTYRLGKVDVPVLRGVDLTVNEGEFVAILGASGSGKSTLLHLVGGLDRPDSPAPPGRCPKCKHALGANRPDACPQCGKAIPPWVTSIIEFRGGDLNSMPRRQLDRYRSRDAGFVFQFYHLLPELTVLENVIVAAMVRRGFGYAPYAPACRNAARALLDQVGLSHRLNHRPVELSGGERQRVAIARSLINEPAVLLADEPTGNLDHTTGETILNMLLAIRAERKLTMLVVTHDPNTAARADRIVRLADGKVIAG